MENINCQNNLMPNIISKETFEKEIELCRKLSEENGGKCCWGSCSACGVIPCLYKLYKGEVVDETEKVSNLKKQFLEK